LLPARCAAETSLHRLPQPAGWAEPLGLDGCRDAIKGIETHRRCLGGGATATSPTARHDDAVDIGDGAVEELHLDAQDGPDADVLGRLGEPDRAVQPLVVGERHRGEPQLLPTAHQLIHARGAVEEREVGVDVEVGPRPGLSHTTAPGATTP
jgi:hypothetical protein